MDREWKGKFTQELTDLYVEYYRIWGGEPDWYMNANPNAYDYDTWVKIVKYAIEIGKEIPEAIKFAYTSNPGSSSRFQTKVEMQYNMKYYRENNIEPKDLNEEKLQEFEI